MRHLDTPQGATSRNSFTEAEQELIRDQVSRLCASPLFSQSKRYPAFLKYVVEQTLHGHPREIKERTIGVEVFQRSAEYDTNADPIVRVAAGEIRKRLAQYYYEPGHEHETRIELPTGSYLPAFHPPNTAHLAALLPLRKGSTAPKLVRWGVVPVVALAAVFFFVFDQSKAKTPGFDQFWSQITEANGSVQLYLGGWAESQPTGPGLAVTLSSYNNMLRITDLLETRKKKHLNIAHVIGPESTEFSGFLDGPVIYVGYYKPLQPMMDSWRYTFVEDPSSRTIWVLDRESPLGKRKHWRTERIPAEQRNESYAIAARIIDRDLNRPMVIVAGIHALGTGGATEVLTNPVYLEALFREAPPDWQEMNLQAVVETRMVDEKPGPPKIIATHFWH